MGGSKARVQSDPHSDAEAGGAELTSATSADGAGSSSAPLPGVLMKTKQSLKEKPKPKETIRFRIFQTFDDPSYSTPSKWISISMMAVIVLATTCFVLESEATSAQGFLYGTNAMASFELVEWVSVIIFTIEYVIRICTCPLEPRYFGIVRFIINPHNVVDALAIVPFWITTFMQLADPGGSTLPLGFVRVVRLVRVFRVFKFSRYSTGIQMFAGAIAKSTQPLLILLFTMALATIILSSVMYLIEGDPSSIDAALLAASGVDPDKQKYCFGTIPASFWWALVTMTTVGYGDCYPSTLGGKLLSIVTMLGGVLILALPITVVGSNFQKMVEMFEEDHAAYIDFDENSDGSIDENELRHFITAKKKEGALKKDVNLSVPKLMQKYDPQGNGTLSMAEFAMLKRDIMDPNHSDPNTNIRAIAKKVTGISVDLLTMGEQIKRIEEIIVKLAAASNIDVPDAASSSPSPSREPSGPSREKAHSPTPTRGPAKLQPLPAVASAPDGS